MQNNCVFMAFITPKCTTQAYILTKLMVWRLANCSSCVLEELWYESGLGAYFPRLGNRTTINQCRHVRNRNLLWHNNKILPFCICNNEIKNRWEFYLYVYFSFQDYCVWSTRLHDKSLVFLSKSDAVYSFPFWCHMDQEYIPKDIKKGLKIKHLNSEQWKK